MNTEAVAAVVREGVASRTPLRIAGRGSWLAAGRPVKANKTLSLNDDSGVVNYVPGDLTLTVRGGTTLAEIQRITGEHGVGLDKMGYMQSIFSEDSLNAMCELRSVFDPDRRSNPGKVVPIHCCKEWNAVPGDRLRTSGPSSIADGAHASEGDTPPLQTEPSHPSAT
ncbi:MAG: FAD-linked oxidase C-terminal domain-containing protein [Gemmatimonadaceae bacterium]